MDWISVKDKMPEPNRFYLVLSNNGTYDLGLCIQDHAGTITGSPGSLFFCDVQGEDWEDEPVAYWMPLPPAPSAQNV